MKRVMEIQTRDDAVAYLRIHGFFGKVRDWAAGPTVMAWMKERSEADGGIMVLDEACYLIPDEGGWCVDFFNGRPRSHFDTINDAVRWVVDFYTQDGIDVP